MYQHALISSVVKSFHASVSRTCVFSENRTRNFSCSVAAVDLDLTLRSELFLKIFFKGRPIADVSLKKLLFPVA